MGYAVTSDFAESEGATPIDADERQGLRLQHVTTRAELNELEQANIQTGLRWFSRIRRVDVLTESFIRNYHRKLFGEVWSWAGEFRRTEKNIGVDPLQIGIRLRILLDDVRFWRAHDTYSPLETAARFHHRLVAIHLFANGNGRHARLMADALLERLYEHRPIAWDGGQNLIADGERRRRYIAALRAADDRDYRPLLIFAGAAEP